MTSPTVEATTIFRDHGRRQSTGVPPCSSSIRFTRLNGLDPKKPRCADSGLGCTDSTHGIGASSRLERLRVAAPEDRGQRRALLRAQRPACGSPGRSPASQPRPRCEADRPGRTVRHRLSSITPASAQGVRSPLVGAGYAEVVDQLLVDVHQALRRRDPGRDREAQADRVPGRRVGVLPDDQHLHLGQRPAEGAQHVVPGGQVADARPRSPRAGTAPSAAIWSSTGASASAQSGATAPSPRVRRARSCAHPRRAGARGPVRSLLQELEHALVELVARGSR